jgi:YafQ family addiction module toxin component
MERIIEKLEKKDKLTLEKLMKKIEEIINCFNIEHYKNLRSDMKEFRRVHIGHFVLVFYLNKEESCIYFDDFDHHDNIYK